MEAENTSKRKDKPKFRVRLNEPLKAQAERQEYALRILCSLAVRTVNRQEAAAVREILES